MNTKYTKEQIALEQLLDALDFYYQDRFISAITLAGAAAEVFGKLGDDFMRNKLEWDAKNNHLDFVVDLFADFPFIEGFESWPESEKEQYKKQVKKEFFKEQNYERNRLKHNDPDEQELMLNPKQGAEKYLSSAIINYQMFKQYLPVEHPLIAQYCKEKGISGNTHPPG